jgi:predicted nucleic acid-binding protein
MNKLKLYLDVCTLCRPFDDQHRMRIRLETDSYFLIMQAIQDKTYELLYSKVHENEIAAINDVLERTEIIETLYQNGKPCSGDLQVIRKRADKLVASGLGVADAAHVAFAEVNADFFISCDDRLIKRSKREKVDVIMVTPVEFCVQENLK